MTAQLIKITDPLVAAEKLLNDALIHHAGGLTNHKAHEVERELLFSIAASLLDIARSVRDKGEV